MAKVSQNNTKAEILKAYDELLSQLQQERSQNTSLKQDLEKKVKTVEAVAAQAKGGATQSIQAIRIALNEQLDKIEDGIVQEQKKFEELREAISIEKDNLENLYKIKAEAESLDALVITQKQAKEKLEKEMEAKREALEDEIKDSTSQWQREQEEYQYNLRIKRRNEEGTYNEKKIKQEKELKEQKMEFDKSIADREKAIAEQEQELNNLRKEVGGFDARLEKSVKAAEQTVTQELTKEFEYKQQLETKDLQAQLQLHQQMIESLKGKVEEQQAYINTLASKTDSANRQVQDIAMKAIENSGIRNLTIPGNERGKDEKKND